METSQPNFDEIGCWSELKLEILRKYATAFTTIVGSKRLHPVYVDGFAGPGVHLSKTSGEMVPGSPLNALRVVPPFEILHWIDLDGDRVDQLRQLAGEDRRVKVHEGDANEVLLSEVLPTLEYESFRRALCVPDPYGLQLDWRVIEAAGQLGTVDIFLNFPIMDMNRNALWSQPERVTEAAKLRMSRFWGDESWIEAAYRDQPTLFGAVPEKKTNEDVVEAFRERLRVRAGFRHVAEPLPMRNSTNAVVYYLFFASRQAVADKIIADIFSKYTR